MLLKLSTILYKGPNEVATSTRIDKLHQKKALFVQKGTMKSPHPFPEGMCLQSRWVILQKTVGLSMLSADSAKRREHQSRLPSEGGQEFSVLHYTREPIQIVNSIPGHDPAKQHLQLSRTEFLFDVEDCGAKDNSCSTQVWMKLGKMTLWAPRIHTVTLHILSLPQLSWIG